MGHHPPFKPPGLDSDAAEEASESDRLYFEAHPGERHYVRAFVPGELPDEWPRPVWTFVLNVKPGVRTRIPMVDLQPATVAEAHLKAVAVGEYALAIERGGQGR